MNPVNSDAQTAEVGEDVFSGAEFADDNPEPRCPCVLLIDTSGSMSGEPIAQVNRGLEAFRAALIGPESDSLARSRIEVAIVKCGGTAQLVQDFVTAESFDPPVLTAGGSTPLGEAIQVALDLSQQRKATLRAQGRGYFQPWVFCMTDGVPTDSWQSACDAIRYLERDGKVAFFGVAVGEKANMDVLGQICVRQPLKLRGLDFTSCFVWLGKSLSSVSVSSPGDQVPLQSPVGWAYV